MLKLADLIALSGVELGDCKIHCATGKQWPPLNAFLEGRFKEWQEDQAQRNFKCRQILSLIHLWGDRWLFAGVWMVKGMKPKGDRFLYATSEVEGLEHLTGRAIVQFEKDFRASYLRDPKYIDRLFVTGLKERRMAVEEFPGYASTLVELGRLRIIVNHNLESWRSALSNVSGIYVISDQITGRQYVGSAYGQGGIWERWKSYAQTGHGGNRELRDLLKEKGPKHADHFQFAILEVCDLKSTKDEVIARESHWKNALLSRQFGYNQN